MCDKKSLRLAQDGRTHSAEYHNTLAKSMPELNAVFDSFSKDSTVSPLELLAAISEMVAIYVDHDSNQMDPPPVPENRSQKKCRFCS